MSKTKLDQEELELLEAYEADEFESELDDESRAYLASAAEESFKKDKRINIRISSRDLEALQRRALEEGLPYQSLVASVLHRYVSGGLKDISADKSNRSNDSELDVMRDEYDFSKAKRAKDVPHLPRLQEEAKSKSRITIMLNKDVLMAFRAKAAAEGIGY